MAKKPASKLGRGLSALMADIAPPEDDKKSVKPAGKKASKQAHQPADLSALDKGHPPVHGHTDDPNIELALIKRGVHELPIDKLERNPSQPRRHFDKQKLAELTHSIALKGVLQPILVRPLPAPYAKKGKKISDRYQIVAGERRWHAAQAAGLEVLPALIRDLSDRDVLEIGIVENVQRADLGALEEAQAYQDLIDQFGRKQLEIADAVGKSRAYVANALRLLSLPLRAQEYLQDGKITAGHARAILSATDPDALAEAIVKDGLSVRAAEKWVRQDKKSTPAPQDAPDANIAHIEHDLKQLIGMGIHIKHKGPGGSLTIKYKSMEQFDDLVRRLRAK